jgi:competence protein ComEA
VSLPLPGRVDRRRALDRLSDEIVGDRPRTPLFRAGPAPGASGSDRSGAVPPEVLDPADGAPVARVRRPHRTGAARPTPWGTVTDPGRLADRLAGIGGRRSTALSMAQRVVRVGAVALCVIAVMVVWTVLRRPVPADQSLPRVGDRSEVALTGADSAGVSGADRPEPAPPSADPATVADRDGAPADGKVTVHVAGAVAAPGVVTLPDGSRVVDAVAAAGGLTAQADPDRVNLAARLADAQRVVVPVVGQPAPEELLPASPPAVTPDGSVAGAPAQAPGRIDLNTASATQLEQLPGVGPATAAAIVEHRSRNGPFRSVEGLVEVRGIGEAKLDAVRDLVTVRG